MERVGEVAAGVEECLADKSGVDAEYKKSNISRKLPAVARSTAQLYARRSDEARGRTFARRLSPDGGAAG